MNKPSSEPIAMTGVVHLLPASRLLKLNLPKFSGDPIKWQDSFKAADHSNTNLTSVEKFNYQRA